MLDKLSATSDALFRDLLDSDIFLEAGFAPIRQTVEREAHRAYLGSSLPDDAEGPSVILSLPTSTLCAASVPCSSELFVARDDSKTERPIIAPEPLATIVCSKSEPRDTASMPVIVN